MTWPYSSGRRLRCGWSLTDWVRATRVVCGETFLLLGGDDDYVGSTRIGVAVTWVVVVGVDVNGENNNDGKKKEGMGKLG